MADRDAKGRWLKGCKAPYISKGNPGGKAGRPRTMKTQIKDALSLAEESMPKIIEQMIARAQNPEDKESQRAAEYLIDRVYGKARQGLDLQHDVGVTLRVVYDMLPLALQGGTEGVVEGEG